MRALVDVVVVASAVSALAITPRVLARRPGPPAAAAGRSVSPAAAPALVTGLVYVNQVLFTVYVLHVHDGDPSFISRYLPAGWFDLASANPALAESGVIAALEETPRTGLVSGSNTAIDAVFA
ncbi:hypothetical protein [Streptomyces atratus]|uniref:hypothetical protein n=1 Tax=Streptomyces atratus TaxID=1893 RepID=UPI0033FBA3A6|nr:hypothetical protein OG781_36430 [Streptomyces sp. NBC_00830]